MSEDARPFDEKLFTKLSTIFGKTIGQNLDIRQIDAINVQVHELAVMMGEFIDKRAELKALKVVKLLNEATKQGFELVDSKINLLDERINELENSNWGLKDELAKLPDPKPKSVTPSPYDASVDRFKKR